RHDQNGVMRAIDVADLDVAAASAGVTPARQPSGAIRVELQRLMTRDAGVVRDADGLRRASARLMAMVAVDVEEANLLDVSRALVAAALARHESRGTHTRSDFPATSPELLGRFVLSGRRAPVFVRLGVGAERERAR